MKKRRPQFFLLILFFFLPACDYGRMWETPAVKPHEQEIMVMPESTVPFDGGEELWTGAPESEMKSPVKLKDPVNIEQGKSLYFTYCAQCHGRYYDGNGTVGQSFSPLPTDLRTVEVQSSPEGVLFKRVSYGVSGGRQPPLASTIEIYDRWRIIAHIKSLGLRN